MTDSAGAASAPKEKGTRIALETVLGVILGVVGLVILFVWVLVDSYQSVNLPTLPLSLRYAIVFGGWFATALVLGYFFPRDAWRWGLRLAIPSIAVLGVLILLDFGGSEGNAAAAMLVAEFAVGALGGVAGARIRARRKPAPS